MPRATSTLDVLVPHLRDAGDEERPVQRIHHDDDRRQRAHAGAGVGRPTEQEPPPGVRLVRRVLPRRLRRRVRVADDRRADALLDELVQPVRLHRPHRHRVGPADAGVDLRRQRDERGPAASAEGAARHENAEDDLVSERSAGRRRL